MIIIFIIYMYISNINFINIYILKFKTILYYNTSNNINFIYYNEIDSILKQQSNKFIYNKKFYSYKLKFFNTIEFKNYYIYNYKKDLLNNATKFKNNFNNKSKIDNKEIYKSIILNKINDLHLSKIIQENEKIKKEFLLLKLEYYKLKLVIVDINNTIDEYNKY